MKIQIAMDENRLPIFAHLAVFIKDPQPKGQGEIVRIARDPIGKFQKGADIPLG